MMTVAAATALLALVAVWAPRRASLRSLQSWAGLGLLLALVGGAVFDHASELVWSYSWLRVFGEGGGWELSLAMSLEQAVIVAASSLLILAAIAARGDLASFALAPLAGMLGVVLLACGATPATQALGIFPLVFAAYAGRERGYFVGFALLLAALGVMLSSFGSGGYVTLGRFALCLGLIGMSQGRGQDEPGTRGMLAYLIPLAGALALVSQSGANLGAEGLQQMICVASVAALALAFTLGFFGRGMFWLNDLGPFAIVLAIASGRLLAPSLIALLALAVVRGIGCAARPAAETERLRARLGWALFFLAHFLCLGGIGSALHGNVAMLGEQAELNRHYIPFAVAYAILALAAARAAARIFRGAEGRAPTWRQVSILAAISIAQLAILWNGHWIGGLDGAEAWSPAWAEALAPWGTDEGQAGRVFAAPALALALFLGMYFWTLKKEQPLARRPISRAAATRLLALDRVTGAWKRAESAGARLLSTARDRGGQGRRSFFRGVDWVRDREATATALMLWLFCAACVAWVIRMGGR